MENSSPRLMWCHPPPSPLRFLPACSVSPVVARWLRFCSPWSSQPVESCACVSQRKASDEGRRVPLLIRTVLAIINRCWQELKLGTNPSHFTVQQRQIQQRGREWLWEWDWFIHSSYWAPVLRPSGAFWGVQVFTLATPVASNDVSLIGRGVTTSSEGPLPVLWSNYTLWWG